MRGEEYAKISMFLMHVNKVTAFHRHGNSIPKNNLDLLSNDQIDMEKWLEDIRRADEAEALKPSHNNRSDEIAFLNLLRLPSLENCVQTDIDMLNSRINSRIAQLRAVR